MTETILYLLFRLLDPSLPTAAAAPEFVPTREQARERRVQDARALRYPDIQRRFAEAGLPYPPQRVFLRLFKDLDVLELWVQPRGAQPYLHLKDYPVCARSGDLGPKRARGDMQVPEGFYRVTAFHPTSMFHLSLRVSYPNDSDRIRAKNADPGGDILIHGECCTIGCVPITNPRIEELYLIALDSYARYRHWPEVHMFPDRLDENGMARLRQRYQSRPELIDFWMELEAGYRIFEEFRIPPRVTVERDGRYRLSPPLQAASSGAAPSSKSRDVSSGAPPPDGP